MASRGIGGMKRRASACASTFAGSQRGQARLCLRFIASSSSRQFGMMCPRGCVGARIAAGT
jgi:hypothetical protein